MLLSERLQGVVDILVESNMELESPKAASTGFVAAVPMILAQAIMQLLEHVGTEKTSLDLGCGNGGWVLLAAAAGFSSYGVEINPFLLDHCQRNYELAIARGFIDPTTPCSFITGDMIPAHFATQYDAFRQLHEMQDRTMPVGAIIEDAYTRLPVSIATADIIYCWSWPTQSQFLFPMLDAEAKQEVMFVLPSYEKYRVTSTLTLSQIEIVKTIFIGRRVIRK